MRLNLTKANSDHTNFMKIEIPKNLINITNIQFGSDKTLVRTLYLMSRIPA